MDLKSLLAKIAGGGELTDAERAFAKSFDLQGELDSTAAAARKKAEDRAQAAEKERDDAKTRADELEAAAKAKADAGKSELEKAQDQIRNLTGTINDLNGKVEGFSKERAQAVRSTAISGLLEKAGIRFIPEVDGKIMQKAFGDALAGVTDEDLANDNVVGPILGTFKAINKGVIADNSGFGAGHGPHEGPPADPNVKAPDQMTVDERQADLKKRGIV